jgi:hypothetical protein
MKFNKCIYLIFFLLILSNLSQADAILDEQLWLGSNYVGLDHTSGKVCTVNIESRMVKSIFGDKIYTSINVDSFSKSYALVNHPFFKGSTFGSTEYIYSVEKRPDGVLVSIINEYWIEIDIENSGNNIKYSIRHLGKKQGGLIVSEPMGIIHECLLSRVRE